MCQRRNILNVEYKSIKVNLIKIIEFTASVNVLQFSIIYSYRVWSKPFNMLKHQYRHFALPPYMTEINVYCNVWRVETLKTRLTYP